MNSKQENAGKKIEREADFYGAMDGASKFVKGDAIAGIIILIINLIGGLIIGMTNERDAFIRGMHDFLNPNNW